MDRARCWAWVALVWVGCTGEPSARVDAGPPATAKAPNDAGAPGKAAQGDAGGVDAGGEGLDAAPYQPVEVVPGEVRVSSTPPGAQVFEGPTPKCKTPCVVQFESASTQRKLLRLSLEGHREVRVFVEPGASRSVDVTLTPLAPSAAPDAGALPDAGAAPDAGAKPR